MDVRHFQLVMMQEVDIYIILKVLGFVKSLFLHTCNIEKLTVIEKNPLQNINDE